MLFFVFSYTLFGLGIWLVYYYGFSLVLGNSRLENIKKYFNKLLTEQIINPVLRVQFINS